jgi:hypothetical protein
MRKSETGSKKTKNTMNAKAAKPTSSSRRLVNDVPVLSKMRKLEQMKKLSKPVPIPNRKIKRPMNAKAKKY